MKKKILLVSHSLSKTGAPLVLVNIANHLDLLGYNVFLYNVNSSQKALINRLNDSIKIIHYSSFISNLKNKKSFFLNIIGRTLGKLLPISKDFNSIIKNNKPDLVIFNTIFHLHLSKIVEKHEIKSIRYIHESWSFLSTLSTADRFNLLTSRDKFIACSENVKYLIESYYGIENVNVIYPILNRDSLNVSQEKINTFTVCSAGSVYFIKGFDIWIEVAKKTLDIDENIIFEWYGSNSDDKYFNYYIKKIPEKYLHRIIYKGEVQNLSSAISNRNLFFLSSREDSFPVVCLEALESGLPLIGFKSGGIEEFEEFGYSTTFKMGEIEQISKSIIEHKNKNQKFLDIKNIKKFDSAENLKKLTKIINHEISKSI